MGFNRSIAIQYLAAAERDTSMPADPLYGVRFRLAEVLIESYMERQEIPQAAPTWVGTDTTFPTEVRGKLMTDLRRVISDKQRIEWLNKGGSSISPEQTPEFFAGTETPVTETPPEPPSAQPLAR